MNGLVPELRRSRRSPLTLRALAAAAAFLFLAGGTCDGGTKKADDPVADTTAPTALAGGASPAAGATDVPLDAAVSVTFSEEMDAASVAGAFTVAGPGGPVAGAVAWDGALRRATFTPSLPLSAGTTYTATVGTGARDLAGNALAQPLTFSFTTVAAPADTTPPVVTDVLPSDGATGVLTTVVVRARFSEPMDAASVAGAFTLTGPGGPVAGAVAWDAPSQSAAFTPASPLAPLTAYTAAVGTGARDLAGNALATGATFHFTTAGVPEVIGQYPFDGDTNVWVGTTVNLEFGTPMDGPSLVDAFSLTGPSGRVDGTATYYPPGELPILRFRPAASLAPFTRYTAVLSAAARSLAGQPLATAFSFSFTTGPGPQWTLYVGNSPDTHWMNAYGRVADAEGRIDCGGTATRCSASYDVGAAATLTAFPAQGGRFVEWRGDHCNFSGTSVTVSAPAGVTSMSCYAFFEPSYGSTVTLSVSYGPWIDRIYDDGGFGWIPHIDCHTSVYPEPSVCSWAVGAGSGVMLRAVPSNQAPAGTVSWTCTDNALTTPPGTLTMTGNLTGNLTMNQDKHCHAELVLLPPP